MLELALTRIEHQVDLTAVIPSEVVQEDSCDYESVHTKHPIQSRFLSKPIPQTVPRYIKHQNEPLAIEKVAVDDDHDDDDSRREFWRWNEWIVADFDVVAIVWLFLVVLVVVVILMQIVHIDALILARWPFPMFPTLNWPRTIVLVHPERDDRPRHTTRLSRNWRHPCQHRHAMPPSSNARLERKAWDGMR